METSLYRSIVRACARSSTRHRRRVEDSTPRSSLLGLERQLGTVVVVEVSASEVLSGFAPVSLVGVREPATLLAERTFIHFVALLVTQARSHLQAFAIDDDDHAAAVVDQAACM